MDCPAIPSSTTNSPPPNNNTEATESEDALATPSSPLPPPPPPPSVQSTDDLADSESESGSEFDENETSQPSSPSSSKVDDTRTELQPTESSEPPPDALLVSAAHCENVPIVEKKDASTQTEIFATETNTINSTALLTSILSTSGLPAVFNTQHPVIVGGMENTNKQHGLDLPGVNTALDHTVLDYNNLTFMNEEKTTSNEDECYNEPANQWRDAVNAPDYDDDNNNNNRRDHHSHQNPCACFLPAEQDAVSAAPQWYHPPMQIPNYAQTAAPSSQMPSYPPPSQPVQMPSYPQPSPSVYPQTSPHPLHALPAYQYYPPYSNYGMYYNNRGGCYYPPNNGALPAQCGHPSCYEGDRPHWWNVNGRRWPDSKDDFCSFGCDRRRRCRREFYVETPRSRSRTLPVKTIVKETAEKNNYQEAVE